MGDQLWTSPITGYRRKGTRLEELRSVLGSSITARAILEPLKSCSAEAFAVEMAQALKQRDFDVAGVKDREDGPVIGFVTRESLRNGTVSNHAQPLTANLLISDSTPLPTVLSVLKGRQHCFVLIGPEVKGIVTRADLNKPPVRVYLFGLISLLEMHLGFWVRAVYREDAWQDALKHARLQAAKKLQAERHKHNEEASLFECIQFCDKRDLVIANAELRERLGLGTKSRADRELERAEGLRNVLAHSQQHLSQKSPWEETIGLIEWVEAVVERSDEHVEQEARRLAGRVDDGLWGFA